MEIFMIILMAIGLFFVGFIIYGLTQDNAFLLVFSWLSIGVMAKVINEYFPSPAWDIIFYVIIAVPIALMILVVIREYLKQKAR